MLYHQPHNSIGNYSYNAFIYQNIHYKPHFHKNFELIYVFSGQVRCSVGEKTATLSPGQFGLCLANEVHALQSLGDSCCWVGVFSGDFVHAFAKQAQGKVGSDFVFTCDSSTVEYLKAHLLKESMPPVFVLKSCLYAVCEAYCSQIELQEQTGKSGLLMQAITDYIAKNYNQRLSLAELAGKLGYNYHYLSKCFHKIFNMSFSEFLNSYRLDAALTMLTETDRDITDIALESGFQSIRSFNDFFKARTGVTPSAYRSKIAKK